MSLSLVDQNGRSTTAAAEGQAALAAGDTVRARQKFAEAGATLEETLPGLRRASDKHLTRFLAASQYFHGGHYRKAQDLCRKINVKFLPPQVRSLFPKFFRDVRERAEEGYAHKIQQQLRDHWPTENFDRILEILQKHPYVMPAGELAALRACVSEELKNYRAAALFYADAIRFTPNGLGFVYAAVSLPLTLPSEGKLEEAWTYIQHQREQISHPVIDLVASLLCFYRASAEKEEGQRRALFADQLRYFDHSRSAHRELPPAQQAKKELRDLMVVGFEAAALALLRLGDKRQAQVICDEAIAYAPDAPQPWVMRGMAQGSEATALDDFKKAVSLGDESYAPYYFLAQAALVQEDFRSALDWAQQALQQPKKPRPSIASQLLAWMALCRDRLGSDRTASDELFHKAIKMNPADESLQESYQRFLHPPTTPRDKTPSSCRLNEVRVSAENFLQDQTASLSEKFRKNGSPLRELESIGA